jgi:S-formylglutathione hydrolase FrmB
LSKRNSRPIAILGALLLGAIAFTTACSRRQATERQAEAPAGTALRDYTFHSDALARDVTYRVIAPLRLGEGQRIRFVYLLHGNGSNYREWSEFSAIGQLATRGYVLVMPEGQSSYYVNSAGNPKDRYEDFITHDLIADAEKSLPTRLTRSDRAIVGNSMGGFAAINLSLKHPELYGFAGALSPAIDVPERKFSLRRWSQSIGFRSIFGAKGSATRASNDPYLLARSADPQEMPFMFISVGGEESCEGPSSDLWPSLGRGEFSMSSACCLADMTGVSGIGSCLR